MNALSFFLAVAFNLTGRAGIELIVFPAKFRHIVHAGI
jgi:hypothetical protein